MKNILFILISVLMIFSFNNAVSAVDVTISGSSRFDCGLLAKYMKKQGYFYIGTTYNNEYYINANTFGAMDAEVIIKDANDAIVGTGSTNEKGNFSIIVPKGDVYRVIVKFHGQEAEKVVKFSAIEDVTVNLGYFNSDTVSDWANIVSLSN